MIIHSSEDKENVEWPWNLDTNCSAFVGSWQLDCYTLALLREAIENCTFSSKQKLFTIYARALVEMKLIPLTKKKVGILTYLQVQKEMSSAQPRWLKQWPTSTLSEFVLWERTYINSLFAYPQLHTAPMLQLGERKSTLLQVKNFSFLPCMYCH